VTWSQLRVQFPRVPESRMRPPVIYHQLELLGQGGYGCVSRVIDLQYGYVMAVKVFHSSGSAEKEEMEEKTQHRKEVEMLANLSHVSLRPIIPPRRNF
jgi:serine/threonine protein kinase